MTRQVPHYLLIGNGRVARHFQHYFSQLNLSFTCWNRNESHSNLNMLIEQSTHILLLISDQAIEPFIDQYLTQSQAIHLHFSGSLVTTKAWGTHPLMTFNDSLYAIEQYHQTHFIIDQHAPDFEKLLPGIPNQHVRLPTEMKAKYHALCVLSGNFSSLLWNKLFSSLEKEFNLPASIAHPYLRQQTQNLITHSSAALTGPLTRNDQQTIEKNLLALEKDPFQEIYKSFVNCYQKIKEGM
jgi:hypothetical protein